MFLPGALIYTHVFVVLREERALEQRFGDEYRRYRAKARRYLWTVMDRLGREDLRPLRLGKRFVKRSGNGPCVYLRYECIVA
jgi:hypothetical protein